jgi:hypothetical protein
VDRARRCLEKSVLLDSTGAVYGERLAALLQQQQQDDQIIKARTRKKKKKNKKQKQKQMEPGCIVLRARRFATLTMLWQVCKAVTEGEQQNNIAWAWMQLGQLHAQNWNPVHHSSLSSCDVPRHCFSGVVL